VAARDWRFKRPELHQEDLANPLACVCEVVEEAEHRRAEGRLGLGHEVVVATLLVVEADPAEFDRGTIPECRVARVVPNGVLDNSLRLTARRAEHVGEDC